MATVIDEISVCTDCIMAIANDDYTGLDYYYDEAAERRMQNIKEGIASFLPNYLVAGDDSDEFSRYDCDCCGEGLAGARHQVFVLGNEEEND